MAVCPTVCHCPDLTERSIEHLDELFLKRWRTLLSVDDIIDDICTYLDKQGQLDNTFFFFTSDNGKGGYGEFFFKYRIDETAAFLSQYFAVTNPSPSSFRL